jgi:glycogen debranching enzyme
LVHFGAWHHTQPCYNNKMKPNSTKKILTVILTSIKHLYSKINKPKSNKRLIEKAFNMALTTLRNRYTKTGIIAGKTHFSDIWLRDSCFASLGSLSVGDTNIVKTNLTTVLKFIKDDGQIPLRVGQKHMFLKFLGFTGQTKARFIEDKGVSIPTDSNSLFLIIAEKYISQTNDLQFAEQYFAKLKLAINWNFTMDQDNDLLIEEGPYANWADSLRKRGKVLYTNVLHFAALDSFSKICALVSNKKEATHYNELKNLVKDKINQLFWNGNYFIDWIHKHKHSYFSTDGNVLAIIFNLADSQQSSSIQQCIHEFDLDHAFSTETNFPKYKGKHIFPLFYPINMYDYHNGLQWLWIGCADAVAKHQAGLTTEAEELLTRMAKKIIKYRGVYEVYYDNKPLKRLIYKSEQGFAWSSGMFVWACKETKLI